MKKTVLIGATGLVGSHLLNQLLDHGHVDDVTVFLRRSTGIVHPKLIEHVIDFSRPRDWASLVKGDVIFLSLGTTRAKAGGKKAQYEVDHTYQYRFAAVAAENGVRTLVLVSSAGARLSSPFFYMRMKAELEKDIGELPIEKKVFIRPGALMGDRKEKRPAEQLGVWLLRLMTRLGLMKTYRPIHAGTVARAMLCAALTTEPGTKAFELNEVFDLAKKNPTPCE